MSDEKWAYLDKMAAALAPAMLSHGRGLAASMCYDRAEALWAEREKRREDEGRVECKHVYEAMPPQPDRLAMSKCALCGDIAEHRAVARRV